MAKSKKVDKKIRGTPEAWESGELGTNEDFVALTPECDESKIDEKLELQLISIRLPKSLIEEFKLIADFHGNSYQPLMRQILQRFATAEMKSIATEYLKKKAGIKNQDSDPDNVDSIKVA